MMTYDLEDRLFEVWYYDPDPPYLLIRSQKNKRDQSNIDVLFIGVEYVEIAHYLRKGLRFVKPTEEETAKVKGIIGTAFRPGWAKLFALTSGDQRFLIAAAAVRVVENQSDTYKAVRISDYLGDVEGFGKILYQDQATK